MVEADEVIYRRYLAQHSDEDFRIILERHKESLVLFLLSYVHNMDDAEELMIDTFAEISAGASFAGKSSFKTWLFSIGKNLALMHLRQNKKKLLLDPLGEDEFYDENISLESDALKKELNRHIYEALGRINDDYRKVLILLYFEEMSPEEIGHVMKKSRKQIYNLIARSRNALKEEMERMGYEYA